MRSMNGNSRRARRIATVGLCFTSLLLALRHVQRRRSTHNHAINKDVRRKFAPRGASIDPADQLRTDVKLMAPRGLRNVVGLLVFAEPSWLGGGSASRMPYDHGLRERQTRLHACSHGTQARNLCWGSLLSRTAQPTGSRRDFLDGIALGARLGHSFVF